MWLQASDKAPGHTGSGCGHKGGGRTAALVHQSKWRVEGAQSSLKGGGGAWWKAMLEEAGPPKGAAAT